VLLSPGTHLSKASNWTTRIFLPPLHPRGIITHKWTHFSTRNSRFLIGGEHRKILRRFDSVRCSCWHDKSPARGQFEFPTHTTRRETAARTFTSRYTHRAFNEKVRVEPRRHPHTHTGPLMSNLSPAMCTLYLRLSSNFHQIHFGSSRLDLSALFVPCSLTSLSTGDICTTHHIQF